jgi:hypothetical protein
MSKKLLLALIGACLLGISSIIIPKFFIHDSYSLGESEQSCVQSELDLSMSEPLDNLLFMNFSINGKVDQKVNVNLYTFWGLKYAAAEVVCNQGTKVIWRRWF